MREAGVGASTHFRLGTCEESGRACLALGLSGGGADCLGVLARGTFSVNGAGIALGAASGHDSFEKSRLTHQALGLSGSGYLAVLALGACDCLVGGARVGFSEAARRSGFEASGRTRVALGLCGG